MHTIFRWIIARIFGNVGKVSNTKLYRSGQDWFGYLSWLWVRPDVIINLSHKPYKDYQDKFEEWLCKKFDIIYHKYPTLYEKDVEEIYEQIHSHIANKLNVLIHCEAGKDRTGFIVALYRLRTEGEDQWEDIIHDWCIHKIPHSNMLKRFFAYVFHQSIEKAKEEMREGGPYLSHEDVFGEYNEL